MNIKTRLFIYCIVAIPIPLISYIMYGGIGEVMLFVGPAVAACIFYELRLAYLIRKRK